MMQPAATERPGRVFLIGAGPGDPELLTLKAVRMLQAADAVVHDRLVSPEILAIAPAWARMFPVGKMPRNHTMPQPAINALLVQLAFEGLTVARLKGGDPFIFGRGSEEMLELRAAGIPVEVAPGITAAQGCAAAAGVPLTHRGLATGVRFVTGHCRAGLPLDPDWKGLADPDTTLVVYMGAGSIGGMAAKLARAGLAADTPVLAIADGTTPRARQVRTRLDRVGTDVAAARLCGPVLFVIGRVAALSAEAAALAVATLPARPDFAEAVHG
jgi:uroporphyrin-III C-methyltransferase